MDAFQWCSKKPILVPNAEFPENRDLNCLHVVLGLLSHPDTTGTSTYFNFQQLVIGGMTGGCWSCDIPSKIQFSAHSSRKMFFLRQKIVKAWDVCWIFHYCAHIPTRISRRLRFPISEKMSFNIAKITKSKNKNQLLTFVSRSFLDLSTQLYRLAGYFCERFTSRIGHFMFLQVHIYYFMRFERGVMSCCGSALTFIHSYPGYIRETIPDKWIDCVFGLLLLVRLVVIVNVWMHWWIWSRTPQLPRSAAAFWSGALSRWPWWMKESPGGGAAAGWCACHHR